MKIYRENLLEIVFEDDEVTYWGQTTLPAGLLGIMARCIYFDPLAQ